MDTVDLRLAQDCETLAVAASEGVVWLKRCGGQSPTVAQQAPSLIGELQKVRNQSRKLARRGGVCASACSAPVRPAKSRLDPGEPRRQSAAGESFADRGYDFLKEINPPGNRRSTGLVTRFGLGLSAGDKDFPVRVRLLTQTDIVKIWQLLPARLRSSEGGVPAPGRRRHPRNAFMSCVPKAMPTPAERSRRR